MNVREALSNIWLRLFAVLLAAGSWVIVSVAEKQEQNRERVVERKLPDIPLVIVGNHPDLVITRQDEETVSVRTRGPFSILRSLSSQNLAATVDLTGITKPGEFKLSFLPQAINVPPGVEVLSIEPPFLRIRMEQLQRKMVPIQPFLVGELPPGFVLGTITITPEDAAVIGPASQITAVKEIATDRIILSGRRSSFTVSVGLVSDQPLVRVAEPVTAQVTVNLSAPEPLPVDVSPPAETDSSSAGVSPLSTATTPETIGTVKP